MSASIADPELDRGEHALSVSADRAREFDERLQPRAGRPCHASRRSGDCSHAKGNLGHPPTSGLHVPTVCLRVGAILNASV